MDQVSSEVEEGEVTDELPTSDEDFSPGSLVIDTQQGEAQQGREHVADPLPSKEGITYFGNLKKRRF